MNELVSLTNCITYNGVDILTLEIVELFAGIGAWKKALENLKISHKTLLAVENDNYALTGYNAIHNTNFKPIDIREIDEKEVPDCDMICYSPPCQSWSMSGKQLGFKDSRGILFFDALRIIKEKKPKYALMENVKGLTTKKFNYEFSVMLKELEKAGYNNYWKVINALDLNIPQNRERVFVISIRKDVDDGNFDFPYQQELSKSITEYLESDSQPPILHNIYGGFKEKSARVFYTYSPTIRTSAGGGHIPSVVLKNEVKQAIVNNIDESNLLKNKRGFKVAYKHDNKWYVEKENYKDFIHSNKKQIMQDNYYIIRQLTSLEAFRLMGFTDEDYQKTKKLLNEKFYKGKDMSNTRLYHMAGNSIVVDVCEALFQNLL